LLRLDHKNGRQKITFNGQTRINFDILVLEEAVSFLQLSNTPQSAPSAIDINFDK